jgi:transcriptional regulator with XRE-family HTH domain
MKKSLSKTSEIVFSESANKLRDLLIKTEDAVGLLFDAKLTNNIAIDLYQLRKKRNITQKQLAEIMQVKQSNISRWEKPGYQGYKVKALSKLVRSLGGYLEVNINSEPKISYVQEFNYHEEMTKIHAYPEGVFAYAHHSIDIKQVITAS